VLNLVRKAFCSFVATESYFGLYLGAEIKVTFGVGSGSGTEYGREALWWQKGLKREFAFWGKASSPVTSTIRRR